MSLKTWKKQYIGPMKRSKLASLKRDLKKWIGLRKNNLTRNRCNMEDGAIYVVDNKNASEYFRIGTETCNQCTLYFKARSPFVLCQDCEATMKCPLRKARCGYACDNHSEILDKPGRTPWTCWTLDRNPEPMIKLIRLAIKRINWGIEQVKGDVK